MRKLVAVTVDTVERERERERERELYFNKQKTKHEKCFIYNTWKRWVNLLPVFFACKNKRY